MGGDAPDGETVESIITESTTPSSTSSLRRRQEDQSLIEKIEEESRIGAECKGKETLVFIVLCSSVKTKNLRLDQSTWKHNKSK